MAQVSDLSLRQLEYVVAVADTLGFHRAAERCHVSQPTLSAQVQHIEDVLGVRLFERDRRGVLVTSPGEDIVARARRILLDVADLIAAASRTRDPLAGRFRVGVIPTIAPYLLPDATPAIHADYPELELVFLEEKTVEVMRDLSMGALDLGLVALDAVGGEFDSAVVMDDPFVVALPFGHPLAQKKRILLSDLDGERALLLDDGHCFRDQALAICSQSGARETDLRATSLGTLVQMVSVGAGITLLPKLAVDVENRRGQLEVRPFAPPVPSRTIGLVWRPTSPWVDAFRTLAASLRQAVAPRLSREADAQVARPGKPEPRTAKPSPRHTRRSVESGGAKPKV
ncbi:MAG: LysR substrate-binding domain-containing protein [Polyangiaceae bacterium]